MELSELLDHVDGWRARRGIPDDKPLNEKQIEQFCGDLHKQVEKFSLRPQRVDWGVYEEGTPKLWKEDARVISYSGNINDIQAYKYAKAMSEGAKGDLFYISDTPAGQLLGNKELQGAVRNAVGASDLEHGDRWQKRIFSGEWTPGWERRLSDKAVGDKPALDDFVSARMMRTQAYGDVRTLTATALSDRVFRCSELKELLTSEKVTAINAVPKKVYAEIYRQTGSLDDVHRAVAASSMALSAGIRADVSWKITGARKSGEVVSEPTIHAVDTTSFYKGSGYAGVSVPREKTNIAFGDEYTKMPDHKARNHPEGLALIGRAQGALQARASQQQRTDLQPGKTTPAQTAPVQAAPSRALER